MVLEAALKLALSVQNEESFIYDKQRVSHKNQNMISSLDMTLTIAVFFPSG